MIFDVEKHWPEAAKPVTTPKPDVLKQQYLDDLRTLHRIEEQNECFFDAMGEAAAMRGSGRRS